MGHFWTARYYHVNASLPYFLPVPTMIGTFGAFIRIRSAILSKRILFDVGIAGPIAGFVALILPLIVGVSLSKVIKLDIINEVVNKTGITKTKAEMAVETVFESMKRSLERGERIELRGFGIFNVRPRKTGIGRNPRTGAEVAIPPGKAVRFKPGKELQALQ